MAAAIICDEYFVASLEVLCDVLNIADDVAGATFMAAGAGSPELSTSIVGLLVFRSDVGVGTIIGSASFNVFFVIGVCALGAGQVLELTPYPVYRDCAVYAVALAMLSAFFRDGRVDMWEAVLLLAVYACYIVLMFLDSRIKAYFVAPPREDPTDPGTVSDAQTVATRNSSRISSRVSSETSEWGEGSIAKRRFTRAASSSNPMRGAVITGVLSSHSSSTKSTTDPALEDGAKGGEEETEEVVVEEVTPSVLQRVYLYVTLPIVLVLWLTVPQCSTEERRNWWPATFLLSTAWIAVFAYVMVRLVHSERGSHAACTPRPSPPPPCPPRCGPLPRSGWPQRRLGHSAYLSPSWDSRCWRRAPPSQTHSPRSSWRGKATATWR